MSAFVGPFLALALTLVVSGLDKLVRPDEAASALRSARLGRSDGLGAVPRSRRLARALGVAEITIGSTAIAVPSVAPDDAWPTVLAAAAVAATFAGFAWFVTRLSAIDAHASCGCFGAGAPPGPAHRRGNLAAAAVAGLVASAVGVTGAVPSLSVFVDAGPFALIAVALLLVASVTLVVLAPSLLANTDPRAVVDHPSTVPTFAVTEPVGVDS